MSTKKRKGKSFLFKEIVHVLIRILLLVIILIPFYVAVVYAFRAKTAISLNPLAWPKNPTWENFRIVLFHNAEFLIGYKNSLLNCVPTVLILLVVTSMAAYILARNKGKFYSIMYTVFTVGILIPFQCIMLSLYLNFYHCGLTSTNLGYIIIRVGMQVSISVLVITSFVKTIPLELEEAARIDGAGKFMTFWKVVFPLMRSVNITQLVLNTLFCWNDYNVAIVILRKNESRTLPLAQIIYFNENTSELNYAFAFFLMTMVPVLILYFCMQKYIVKGIMSGAVKG
jgi:raffinose/stachyose/melibiose transport system permease protein